MLVLWTSRPKEGRGKAVGGRARSTTAQALSQETLGSTENPAVLLTPKRTETSHTVGKPEPCTRVPTHGLIFVFVAKQFASKEFPSSDRAWCVLG